MIRPLTIATFLMACGSGLYLYQSKHEVQMLDRTIEKSVRDTAALREQSRLLAAEWTMLNDPERLRQFADLYLAVKPIAPSQFTSLGDLNSRLPAPVADQPRPDAPAPAEAVSEQPEITAPVVAAETIKPLPPAPAAAAPAAAVRPAEHRIAAARPAPPDAARPAPVDAAPQRVMAVALPRAPESRPVQESRPLQESRPMQEARGADARVGQPASSLPQRAAFVPPPQPVPSAPRPAPAAQPFAGSLLGMAHGAASPPPVPRPVPVNATNYYN